MMRQDPHSSDVLWREAWGKVAGARAGQRVCSPAGGLPLRCQARGQVRIGATRCGGFAMILALILLALTAMALSALTQLAAEDFRRTREARIDAQLRQLLMAGAADAQQEAGRWPAEAVKSAWEVALPAEVGERLGRVSVSVSREGDGVARVVVVGQLEGRSMRQTVVMSRVDGRWRVSDAQLGG